MEALNSLWPHASRALEVCRLKRHLSDNEGSVSMFRLAKGEELEGFSGRDDVEEIGGPDGLLEEVTPSNAGGTEVHGGWRTGRRVTLHEIEGRYFVEWNADEGSTSGWEEIYRGTSWEDFDAFVAEYFDLYSGSVAPSEDLGLPMASGPTASRFLKRRWLGALTAATWLLTTGEICRFGDGSLVVTRQLEGKVLGLFSDLDVTWSKIWFSDTTYRSLFLPEGSEEVQKEPWRLPRSAIGLEADRLGVSSRVRFVIQVHLSLDQRSSWNAVHRRRVPCHGVVVLSSCVPRPHGVVVARRQRRLCWKECDHVEAKENRSARQHRSALGASKSVPAGSSGDLGPAVLARLRSELQMDDEWCQLEGRELRWTGGAAPIVFSVSDPFEMNGDVTVKVTARTTLVSNVEASPDLVLKLVNIANVHASVGSLVWLADEREVVGFVTQYAHEGNDVTLVFSVLPACLHRSVDVALRRVGNEGTPRWAMKTIC